jgi:hypothetical protein
MKIPEDDIFKDSNECHKIWHKFSNWLVKTFGKDLHGEWEIVEITNDDGKIVKFKSRSFNELELSRRLVGYDVMCKIERYVKRCCPEIKIIGCDDSYYSSSFILLIPHPRHGITIMFIPQCTTIQNQLFLYDGHFDLLMEELKKMKYVYKNQI